MQLIAASGPVRKPYGRSGYRPAVEMPRGLRRAGGSAGSIRQLSDARSTGNGARDIGVSMLSKQQ